MKKILLSLSIFASTSSFAANLNGIYNCSDESTLQLKQVDIGRYRAAMRYEDGAVSTLREILFRGESLRGQLLRDDDDSLMGHAIIVNGGTNLNLTFLDGDKVTCAKQ
jgi:hypothetical protein